MIVFSQTYTWVIIEFHKASTYEYLNAYLSEHLKVYLQKTRRWQVHLHLHVYFHVYALRILSVILYRHEHTRTDTRACRTALESWEENVALWQCHHPRAQHAQQTKTQFANVSRDVYIFPESYTCACTCARRLTYTGAGRKPLSHIVCITASLRALRSPESSAFVCKQWYQWTSQ